MSNGGPLSKIPSKIPSIEFDASSRFKSAKKYLPLSSIYNLTAYSLEFRFSNFQTVPQ